MLMRLACRRLVLVPLLALGIGVATGFASAAAGGDGATSVVYLVRHAEKSTSADEGGAGGPRLTEAGRHRAEALDHALSGAGITAIFSSDYARTRETAGPLAERLGLEVETYDPRDLEGLAALLRSRRGRSLVVGHSNTTPRLAELLGGDPGEPIDEATEYDRLYVLILGGDGHVTTLHLRYGQPSPSKAEGHDD